MSSISLHAGRLIVICGPMFAGKTSELMRRVNAARGDGVVCSVFKPARDNRYGAAGALKTHDGRTLDAAAVGDVGAIAAAAAGAGLVAIDEGHFFGDALVGPVMELVNAGKLVLVAGLERDHRGGPFAPFEKLLIEADEVHKLSVPCARCGRPAIHSQRMSASDERIVVGGAGMYEPRCRGCFGIL